MLGTSQSGIVWVAQVSIARCKAAMQAGQDFCRGSEVTEEMFEFLTLHSV